MIEISASVLNVNKENATRTFYNLETSKIDYFHIDVMDGKFVKNNNSELMKDYALTISHISNLGLDVHLMVEDIEEYVDEYLMLNPEYITFHIEATEYNEERIMKIINQIKSEGTKVGISISPETDIEKLKPFLNYIHMILVMTVVPGEGGQKLIPETLEKVKSLKQYLEKNDIDIDIEVDGGIDDQTATKAIDSGANILVIGKFLISAENIEEAVKKIKN